LTGGPKRQISSQGRSQRDPENWHGPCL